MGKQLWVFVTLVIAVVQTGTAFAISDWSSVPSPIKAAVDTEFGMANVKGMHHHVESLKVTAIKIHRIKGVNAANNAPISASYLPDGQKLPDLGKALRIAEKQAYYDDYGALDPEAWQTAAAAPPDEQLAVMIWLFTQQPKVSREEMIANPIQAAVHSAAIAVEQARAKSSVQSKWSSISTSEVTFLQGAPVAFANLTPAELAVLAKVPVVAGVYLRSVPSPQSTSYVDTLNADTSGHWNASEDVCIVDRDQPSQPNGLTLSDQYCLSSTSLHSRCVMGAARSDYAPYGTSRNSTDYFAAANCDNDASEAIDWCHWTKQANVVNYSMTCTTGINRLLDFWTDTGSNAFVTVAAGNGNSATTVSCPNSCGSGTSAATSCDGFNVLNVGGSNDCGDATRTNDLIFCKSSDLNPSGTDRELPHLVAPAQDIDADNLGCGDGTSYAAPMVAGIASTMIRVNSSFSPYPEVVRSILMTSAGENVDSVQFDLHDGVDDRDGAGEVDAEIALELTDSSRKVNGGNSAINLAHDFGTIYPADFTNDIYSEIYYAKTTAPDMRLRVVLSWDGTADCTSSKDSSTCGATTLDADLDLRVHDSLGVEVESSITVDNSYEFVEFAATANATYTIKITASSWTKWKTVFGLSWYFAPYGT